MVVIRPALISRAARLFCLAAQALERQTNQP